MENSDAKATEAPGPRYAPHDPTLTQPWRALVDTSTGYIYYWNPETNVTQYERPLAQPPPPLAPPLPPGPMPATTTSTPIVAPNPNNSYSQIYNSTSVQAQSSAQQGFRSDSVQPSANGVVAGHPKLAPIPVARNPQGMGNIHLSHAPSGHLNASGGLGAQPNMLKRGASDHMLAGQDFKRQRMHGFFDQQNVLDVEAYRRQHEVTAMGDNVPAPFITFDAAGFPPEILRELHSAGFSLPTPIQAQSWPIALQNRDIVAIAKTGSGKTLGYLLPAFVHLKQCHNNSRRGPTVLVLAPTRELATQIQEEALKFGRSSRITSTCVYGGAPKGPQLRDLERGADIVVATPGRLNDFLDARKVSLQQVSFVVLDEADRMLDMGFEPQIRKIVKEIPPRRQTLMYTATWPKEVRKIANDLLVNPVQVNIGNVDELCANKSITQYVEVVAASAKHRRLEQILCSQEPGSKIIVFCSTKRMCDQLSHSLRRQFGAVAIHGDKSQNERDWVLSQFRAGRTPVLVATDVAARGLDIKDIRVVINYDFPTGIEDYVHRIGRTGRAGATGLAYTFFSDQDAKYAQDLIKVLEVACQKVPPELKDMAARSGYTRGGSGRWDSGGHGRGDGGRGGREAGRGGRAGGGRAGSGRELFGVRGGGWGMGGERIERQQRTNDRFGAHGKFDSDADHRHENFQGKYDKDGPERHHKKGHDRAFDDEDRGRSDYHKFDERARGYSYSRSPSWSRGRSYSRSRSRSWSNDRYDAKLVSRRENLHIDVRNILTLDMQFAERDGLPARNVILTMSLSRVGNRSPYEVGRSHHP